MWGEGQGSAAAVIVVVAVVAVVVAVVLVVVIVVCCYCTWFEQTDGVRNGTKQPACCPLKPPELYRTRARRPHVKQLHVTTSRRQFLAYSVLGKYTSPMYLLAYAMLARKRYLT